METHRERVSTCPYTFHVTASREISIRVIECAAHHATCAVLCLERQRRHHIFTAMCTDVENNTMYMVYLVFAR